MRYLRNVTLVRQFVILIVMALLAAPLCLKAEEKKELDPKRWEKDIQAFEAKDKESFPKPGGVLFVGSSSIRGWDLKKFFPDLNAINRGFGGSHMEDPVYYAERIVIPYKPRTIVLYEGDNDIGSGKTPERVFSDFKKFEKVVHASLPKTPIVFIAVKPSIKRWDKIDKIRETNKLIQEYAKKNELLDFVDIDTPTIGDDGKPMKSIFKDDGLHLNDEGYKIWKAQLMPYLNR